MRRSAWIGTIAVHVATAAVLAYCVPRRAVPDAITATVELFGKPVPVPVPVPDLVSPPTVRASAAAPAAGRRGGGGRRAAAAATGAGPVAAIVAETGAGAGAGTGAGTGTGTGAGTGALGARVGQDAAAEIPRPKPIAMAPEKPKSKARPARLIRPVRSRATREGEVFVFHVKIDDDGYVQGARLVQGVGNRRKEDDAQRGVFRFRYDPARDDAGDPIASELDQDLMFE